MAKFITAKWLGDNGKWLSHVGRGACGVVGSIGACVGAHMCVWAPSHTGVHGVESDVRLTRVVDRLASPGDE
jgi:hypothetical protein